MEFAKNLKRERENIGLSQAEFADRIGVAQPMVAQYEMGMPGDDEHLKNLTEYGCPVRNGHQAVCFPDHR